MDSSEDETDLVTCGVCLEQYDLENRKPKFLQCSHTICLQCLKKIWQNHLIVCPICRKAFAKANNSFLPNNFYALHMLKRIEKKKGELVRNIVDPLCFTCNSTEKPSCVLLGHSTAKTARADTKSRKKAQQLGCVTPEEQDASSPQFDIWLPSIPPTLCGLLIRLEFLLVNVFVQLILGKFVGELLMLYLHMIVICIGHMKMSLAVIGVVVEWIFNKGRQIVNKLLAHLFNSLGIYWSKRILDAIKFIAFSLIFLHFNELSLFLSVEVLVEWIAPHTPIRVTYVEDYLRRLLSEYKNQFFFLIPISIFTGFVTFVYMNQKFLINMGCLVLCGAAVEDIELLLNEMSGP